MSAHNIKQRREDRSAESAVVHALKAAKGTGERDAEEDGRNDDRKGTYSLVCAAAERTQTADDERQKGERIKR